MNTTIVPTGNLRDWATLAALELRDAIETTKADPEFQEWAAAVLADQNSDEPRVVWHLDDCLHTWVRRNHPTVTEPPLARPSWAVERNVTGDWENELVEIDWAIYDRGQVGEAEVERVVFIESGGTITSTEYAVRVPDTEEPLAVVSADLDRVIDALVAARDTIRNA